jgi:hypothetical protein
MSSDELNATDIARAALPATAAPTAGDSGRPKTQALKPPLRVGLLLDDFTQPQWAARAISDLAASTAVEIVVVVLNDAPRPSRRRFSRLRSWFRNRQYLLYALYQRIDRWWFEAPDDPFADTALETMLGNVPVLRVAPRMTKHCDFFNEPDVEAIRAYHLDVAVRFGFRILKGDALRIARHGVWSYHHGDNLVNRGGPAGFWEVMEGNDVTGSVLQRLTENLDDGQVLYRSFSSTNKFSVTKNQAGFYWTSALILRRVMEDLHNHGPEGFFDARDRTASWHGYSNRLYVAPKNREMAGLMFRVARRYIVEKVHETFAFEQWFVAYGIRRTTPLDRLAPDTNYYRFRQLVPPPDRFWADPFAVEYMSSRYIFVEEFFYATDRGRISVFEVDAHGIAHGPVPVLEREYHLSYPFVFEWAGSYYMIPETHAREQIELFRAVNFPHEWVFDRVLISNVRAVDATLAEMNGRWWMFVSIASDPVIPWDELSIFYADSPLGPWTPHVRNPVKSDVRNSRPAGRLFRWNGRMYRPAQDCSRRYGHSIVMNEVKHIDPETFVETEVSRITPGWTSNLLATHTINADGTLTVIDGLRRRRRGSR